MSCVYVYQGVTNVFYIRQLSNTVWHWFLFAVKTFPILDSSEIKLHVRNVNYHVVSVQGDTYFDTNLSSYIGTDKPSLPLEGYPHMHCCDSTQRDLA